MVYKYLKIFPVFLLGFNSIAMNIEPDGGGEFDVGQLDNETFIQSENKWHQYIKDRNDLIDKGLLLIQKNQQSHPLYQFPLKTNQDYPSFYGISNFVDNNKSFPDKLMDYNCGLRTYDLKSGYNHAGIDYYTWPYSWNKLDKDEVQVIAAATGMITTKLDGNFDRECDLNNLSGTQWNAVYITHEDGSTAWYGHLKNGSLTSKRVGESVVAGEYLGVVGSSGYSSGPHLHFESYDSNGTLVDPYTGTCNTLTANSWWIDQKPYFDSKLNQAMTHHSAPQLSSCPSTVDDMKESNQFNSGDTIYFAAYYRDQLFNQVSNYQIMQPDGSIFSSWNHSQQTQEHFSSSYWYWRRTLPSSADSGRWTFRVTFEGETSNQYFYVNDKLFGSGFEN